MHLDPKSEIAGLPALDVRRFFRNLGESSFSLASIQNRFSLSPRKARQILEEFLAAGLIVKANSPKNEQWWKTTIKGQALAIASAAQPLHRKTADRILKEFVERVKQANSNPYYLYRVTKVVLFGSYLRPKNRINDIDVAISIRPRESDENLQASLEKYRIARSNRNFSSFLDQILWPRAELWLFLKSRSRTISLHDAEGDASILAETQTLVLLEDGEWTEGF